MWTSTVLCFRSPRLLSNFFRISTSSSCCVATRAYAPRVMQPTDTRQSTTPLPPTQAHPAAPSSLRPPAASPACAPAACEDGFVPLGWPARPRQLSAISFSNAEIFAFQRRDRAIPRPTNHVRRNTNGCTSHTNTNGCTSHTCTRPSRRVFSSLCLANVRQRCTRDPRTHPPVLHDLNLLLQLRILADDNA